MDSDAGNLKKTDSCNALYMELPLEDSAETPSVSKCGGQLILGAGKLDHISLILAHPYWLPVSFNTKLEIFGIDI